MTRAPEPRSLSPARWSRVLGLAACWASVACNSISVDRYHRPCDSSGGCPSEDGQVWACHPEKNICVPQLKAACPAGPEEVCPSVINTGDPCPSETSFVPCSDAVTDCSLGCRTCGPDHVWSACTAACTLGTPETCANCNDHCTQSILHATPICDVSGSTDPRDINNHNFCDYQGPCQLGYTDGDDDRSNGCETDSLPPAPATGFAAVALDTEVQLSWTYPDDADLYFCVIRRVSGALPADHESGTLVVELAAPASGETGTYRDTGLTNGTSYSYALFCSDIGANWQEDVGAGNSGTATPFAVPPARVVDLTATQGDDASVTLTFTMPDPRVHECRLLRKNGGNPTGHADASAASVLGSPFSGAAQVKRVTDFAVTNGFEYTYAVFCRNDTEWNDSFVLGENAVKATPLDRAPANPVNLVATDGEDGQTTVTFTTPPAPMDVCVLLRKTGSYPTGHEDPEAQPAGAPHAAANTPVSEFFAGLLDGQAYYFAAFCRRGTTWNDTVILHANADAALPLAAGTPPNPIDLAATDGDDGQSTITFTPPAGSSLCVLMRKIDALPAGASDPDAVSIDLTVSTVATANDTGLANGTKYFYAAFCQQGGNWNNAAALGMNAAVITPLDTMPDNPVDLVASDGESNASTITFTAPASSFNECVLMRRTGTYAAGHADPVATQVGSFSTASLAESVVDAGLTDGTVYYYAAFCRRGTTWNEHVVIGGNADTGVPQSLDVPQNPRDVVAQDGANRTVEVTFTTPASGFDQCILLRKELAYPRHHGDAAATRVGSAATAPGSAESRTDTGLTNGVAHYYAVFCVSQGLWNDAVVPGENGDVGTPMDPAPARATALAASDGENARVTVTFATPTPPMDECRLFAKTGDYPEGPKDEAARQVGAAVTSPSSSQSQSDVLLDNGTVYYYAVFCRNGTTWNQTVVEGENADSGLPIDIVRDFVASDAEDKKTTLTYTMPAGATACKILRKGSGYPANDSDGTLVSGEEQTGGGGQSVIDGSLVNGATYRYAVFCRVGATYRNPTEVVVGDNADTASPLDPPPSNPALLVASDGDDASVTVEFTTPNLPFDECALLKKVGGYSDGIDDPDDEELGSRNTTPAQAVTYVDTSVENGITYYYSVVCRNGTTWNNEVIAGENGDTGSPLEPGMSLNPDDLVAWDGEPNQVTVVFTTPDSTFEHCDLLRKESSPFTDHADAGTTLVASYTTPNIAVTEVDHGALNGHTYYYAVFCYNELLWNDALGANSDSATPIDIVQDFDATDGDKGVSQLTYHMPAGALACAITRKEGTVLPTNAGDGVVIGGEQVFTTSLVTVADTSVENGKTYAYAVFCRADAVFRNTTADLALNADLGRPISIVTVFSASDGEDGKVTIAYEMPAGADACKVMRDPNHYPSGLSDTDLTLVGGTEQSGGGAKTVVDTAVVNGTSYYYVAFCRAGPSYTNNEVDPIPVARNADFGTPIDAVADLVASDGEDNNVHLTFTIPASAAGCQVIRKTGLTYPTSLSDGTLVGGELTGTGAQAINDPAPNGDVYSYAVFCRAGGTYVNFAVDSAAPDNNGDQGRPIARVQDFAASKGEDGVVHLTYTMPVGAAACKIKRTTGVSYPASNGDGTAVGTERTTGGAQNVADNGVTNGTTYRYAVFCRSGASAATDYINDTVDSLAPGVNADYGLPVATVSDFDATDGEPARTTLTYTKPDGAAACKVMRKGGDYPANSDDGTQVNGAEQTGTGVQTVIDSGLTNGTQVFYAVFCRAGSSAATDYINDAVDFSAPLVNAGTALPIALATGCSATSNEDIQSHVTFTAPAGAVTCKILRKTSAYPSGPSDATATQVGGEVLGGTYLDTGLDNGVTYYYAVFCRVDSVYRNSTVTAGQNANTGKPSACNGQTFTFTVQQNLCTDTAFSTSNVVLMHLKATSTCNNTLTKLTLSRATGSATVDTDLTSIRLYLDTGSMGFDAGDAIVPGTSALARLQGGAAEFSGMSQRFTAGESKYYLLVANTSATATRSIFVPEITNTGQFTVTDDVVAKVLSSGSNPLFGGVHAISSQRCSGVPADPGTGSLFVPDVTTLRSDGGSWANGGGLAGAGDEGTPGAVWTVVGGDNGTATMDCSLTTCGSSPSWNDLWDNGKSGSDVLHIDTGIRLNWPICSGPKLRVYGTNYNPGTGTCNLNRLNSADLNWIVAYAYNTPTAVDAATEQDFPVGAPHEDSGPTCGVAAFMDLNLGPAFNLARSFYPAMTNFEVRLLVESNTSLTNGNLNKADNKRISVPEIYLQLRYP